MFGPVPFRNAWMCGVNGCGGFPQVMLAAHPDKCRKASDLNLKVKHPEELANEAVCEKPIGLVTLLCAPSKGEDVLGPSYTKSVSLPSTSQEKPTLVAKIQDTLFPTVRSGQIVIVSFSPPP